MDKTLSWLKQNWLESLILLIIILTASFLRFYKIDGYMTFLGDEGRDALVIKGMLINHHFPLLGPPTSVGNMYLGPLYYYMMAIPMSVFWLNPVAAAGMDALIGVGTVIMIYFLGRMWFGRFSAVLSSLLYALSPVTITYSHSSWNPNPAPFFALLMFLGFYLARVYRNYLWFSLVGISLAFAIQMHYLALLLLPVGIILWLIERRNTGVNFSLGTVLAVLLFLFLMSPLALFDLRHNFLNLHAILSFFKGQTGISSNPLGILVRVPMIYVSNLVTRYMSGFNLAIGFLTSVLVIVPIIFYIRAKKQNWPMLALSIWLGVGLLGLSFYKQDIYDHYLGFLNPAPYLLLGGLIFFTREKFRSYLFTLLLVILGGLNLIHSPLLNPPQYQLFKTQQIVRYVMNLSSNKPFNFALLSAHNYDSAYQFYFGEYGSVPMMLPFNNTGQLFVVCEDPVCQPTTNPKYEIAAFGWSKIEYMKDYEGVKIYKLVYNPH